MGQLNQHKRRFPNDFFRFLHEDYEYKEKSINGEIGLKRCMKNLLILNKKYKTKLLAYIKR